MKKVFIALMFLMLVGGALAMTAPVSVKSTPGDWIKIYVRPVGGSSILGLGNGSADSDGLFSYTFFSLNVPDVKFTIFVIRGGEKIRDVDFLGHNISKPLSIDCSNVGCEIVEEVEVVETGEIENETEIENESIVEEDSVELENESIVEEDSVDEGFTGMAIFVNEDGSINWIYSGGAGVVVLLFIVFMVFMVCHSKNRKGEKVVVGEKKELDDDEKELEDMEKKVKETAEKIKNVKEKRERRTKIYDAKVKLAEEERELKELEDGGSKAEVEKQEDVVEKAEDKVEDAEN